MLAEPPPEPPLPLVPVVPVGPGVDLNGEFDDSALANSVFTILGATPAARAADRTTAVGTPASRAAFITEVALPPAPMTAAITARPAAPVASMALVRDPASTPAASAALAISANDLPAATCAETSTCSWAWLCDALNCAEAAVAKNAAETKIAERNFFMVNP